MITLWSRVRITHLSRKCQLTIPIRVLRQLWFKPSDALGIEQRQSSLRIMKIGGQAQLQ
jgi:bifunctional DNA-binding transcriptional regulator/antitoxin component of YhaV-PrlF toxin-antitoxin module